MPDRCATSGMEGRTATCTLRPRSESTALRASGA